MPMSRRTYSYDRLAVQQYAKLLVKTTEVKTRKAESRIALGRLYYNRQRVS